MSGYWVRCHRIQEVKRAALFGVGDRYHRERRLVRSRAPSTADVAGDGRQGRKQRLELVHIASVLKVLALHLAQAAL